MGIMRSMKSKDIKQSKKDEEQFEEASIESFGEDTYESKFSSVINKTNDKYNNFKKNKKVFIPSIIIFSIIIFSVVVSLIFILADSEIISGLTSININCPTKIYINEEIPFSIESYGTGDLSTVKYDISLSNNKQAALKYSTLSGEKVNNVIKGFKTGDFSISVLATQGRKELNFYCNDIAICRRLDIERFENTTIDIEIEDTVNVKFDLGEKSNCYQDLTYKIENPNIAVLDANNKITGLSVGTTTLTISDKQEQVTLIINVYKD